MFNLLTYGQSSMPQNWSFARFWYSIPLLQLLSLKQIGKLCCCNFYNLCNVSTDICLVIVAGISPLQTLLIFHP